MYSWNLMAQLNSLNVRFTWCLVLECSKVVIVPKGLLVLRVKPAEKPIEIGHDPTIAGHGLHGMISDAVRQENHAMDGSHRRTAA